jgi:hypothetical protein
MQNQQQQQDWTQTPVEDFAAFQMADYEVAKDADQIAEEAKARDFKPAPVGIHTFVVEGPYEAPKMVRREGYYQGRQVAWNVMAIGLRLSLESDRSATMLEFFDLPPSDPTEQIYYNFASKANDGKYAGFGAEKTGHFLARLGWHIPKGGRMPAEARDGRNWKGRRIQAEVELKQQKPKKGIDPTTAQPFVAPPARLQIKLYSFEVAPGGPLPLPKTAPQQQYAPQAPQQQYVAPQAPPAMSRGLGNL